MFRKKAPAEKPAAISNEEAVKRLTSARVKMLFINPFFGQMALKLKFVDATDDPVIDTAATDYRNFYYDRNFIARLDKEELVFLFGHELYHCIYEHFVRRDKRNPMVWNWANDYVINGMLKKEGVGKVITQPDIHALIDKKYDGMTSEQVYNQLIKDNAKDLKTLDYHFDLSGKGSSEDSAGSKIVANVNGSLSEEEAKELSDSIKQSVLESAMAVGAGNVPGDIKRMIQELTESKMDWREHLNDVMQSLVKSDFSWQRPNRKGWHMTAVLPGMIAGDEDVEVSIAIDNSGSISTKMLKDFLGEVKGIMDQFNGYKIHIWQFDTRVQHYDMFTHDDGRDISEYEIVGGGGTDFMCNWKFMEEKGIVPGQLLMFTDGYDSSPTWGRADYCDTLFLIHGSKSLVAPHGKTVYYEA